MRASIAGFLAFLRYNRNVSPHTLRAYRTDLELLLAFLATRHGCRPSQVGLAAFDTEGVRGFLGVLHDRGNSRASTARRLAAIRTFARYLVREGLLADDPTALVGAPRKEQTLPAHLPTRRHGAAAGGAGRPTRLPGGATAPSSSCSMRRASG